MAARYDIETTIQKLESSFEGDLAGDDSDSDDGLMTDHDQAGLEGNENAGTNTVISSSEHGEESDGGNSEGINEDTAESVDPEENEDAEESCGSENELEQGATAKKTRKRVRDPQTWKRIKRSRLRNSGKSYISTAGKKVHVC